MAGASEVIFLEMQKRAKSSFDLDFAASEENYLRMGLFQDQTDSLSELRRLAALVMEPARLHEIGPTQWPLAMISYGLATCNDPDSLAYSLGIYPRFVEHADLTARQRTLSQLAAFITQRRGDGWRAFENFALADPDASLRRHAAFLIATITPPDEEERFRGVAELVRLLGFEEPEDVDGLPARTPLLDAALSLSDLRFLPLLKSLITTLPEDTLKAHLHALQTTPNALSCEWLMTVAETRPELAGDVADTLCRIAPAAEEIVDLVLPVPTWQFQKPVPQPLHGWTRAEYFARMLPRLAPKMKEEELQRTRLAYDA